MVIISPDKIKKIIKQAKEHLPIECCGILAGTVEQDLIEIKEIYPMKNVDHSPEHFSMDPKEQFEAYYAAREKGFVILGNYHSHPSTPARPSKEDIKLAYNPDAVYMIISLSQENPVIKCFQIKDGNYDEIPLKII